jgi:hypothetical protein
MQPNNTPLINGRAYDFAQIVANVLGVPIMGIQSIEYKEEQEKTNNFGAGKWAVSRGHGAVNADAKIEISMNDVEAMRTVAPNGRLLDLPAFPITVTFLNEQKVVTHTLMNCEFVDDGMTGAQGDTDLVRSFALVVSHIKYK